MKPIVIETPLNKMNFCELCVREIEDGGGYVEIDFNNHGFSLRMKFHDFCHSSYNHLKERIDTFKSLTKEQLEASKGGVKNES